MTRTAAVVGAGVLGRLLALRLRRAGYRVHLFERGDWEQRSCSFAAAGLLTPVAEMADASTPALLSLGLRSRALWQDLLPTLAAPVALGVRGALHVAREADLLHELHARLARKAPHCACFLLGAEQLRSLAPALAASGYSQALYIPEDGYIESHAAMRALQLSLLHEGVECHMQTPVAALEPGVVRLDAGEALALDHVFDCRGLGARYDLPLLRGVRGELIEVHAPEVDLELPVHVMHERYPIYIVPREGRTYAIGATSIESDSQAPVTVKAALELLSAAYSVHPGFHYGHITGLVANSRPAFDNNMPQLHTTPGLWRLNGLYRHGFLLAPVLVDCTMRHLAGQVLADDQQSLLG